MSEVIITIDGVEYRPEGHTLKSASESSNAVILRRLDSIDSRLDGIESELKVQRKDINTLATVMVKLDRGQEILTHDVAHLQTSVNWTLGAIAVFATVLGGLPGIKEWFKKPEPKSEPSGYELEQTVRRIVREMLSDVKS